MIAVMPMENHTTFKTVDTLLDLGADPYQADAEGMTVFDRSRCAYPQRGWNDRLAAVLLCCWGFGRAVLMECCSRLLRLVGPPLRARLDRAALCFCSAGALLCFVWLPCSARRRFDAPCLLLPES